VRIINENFNNSNNDGNDWKQKIREGRRKMLGKHPDQIRLRDYLVLWSMMESNHQLFFQWMMGTIMCGYLRWNLTLFPRQILDDTQQ
ncbi:2948_t:CDS:1, partial [Acaulospora colombiana]